MKMILLGLMTLAILITGCDENDKPLLPSATVFYNDGSAMGVTKQGTAVNGGFQIFDINTVVGFIGADAMVNNVAGIDLGICQGATVTDVGLSGDCTIPTDNPNLVPDLLCPDTRNGDFNPAYSPAVCNANGYFWCSLALQCLDKPINVNVCGEIGSEQRRNINYPAQ